MYPDRATRHGADRLPPGWLLAIVPVAFASCSGGQRSAEPQQLQVEYAGCASVRTGPVCVLPETASIRVWVYSAPGASVRLRSDGFAAPVPEPQQAHGGALYELQFELSASDLRIRVSDAAGAGEWQLRLAPPETVPPAIEESWQIEDEQGVAAAFEWLQARVAPEGASGLSTAQPAELSRLARLALASGLQDRAIEFLQESIRVHADAGNLSKSIDDATMLSWLLLFQRRDFTRVRALLDDLPEDWGEPAESRYFMAYYRGLLAVQSGVARDALRYLDNAAGIARRLDLRRLRAAADQVLAEQLQRLGRRAEAEALLAGIGSAETADLKPCERAQLANNRAWSRLLMLEAGEATDDPTPMLEEALATLEQACPEREQEKINILIDLALARLHAGHPDQAAAALAQARRVSPRPELRLELWWKDIEARIAMRRGNTDEAIDLYAALAALADATLSPDAQWRAAVGGAQARRAAGDIRDALGEFARAESLVAKDSLQVPLQEGRETFVARREWATRAYLETLLAAGREADGFAVARRARIRVLKNLQREARLETLDTASRARWYNAMERYRELRETLVAESAGDWQLAADQLALARRRRAATEAELQRSLDDAFAVLDRGVAQDSNLPRLADGELVLLFHPLPEGWVGFAGSPGATRGVRLDCVRAEMTAEASSRCLLAPFGAEIAAAARLRILPAGFLRDVDFHALPWQGRSLLEHQPVVYGLDLRPAATSTPARATRTALLVADPTGNLPAARREARTVSELLGASGDWRIQTLEGAAAAANSIAAGLAANELFHYAGHAFHAGSGGWGSSLPLAGGESFAVGDILALARSPRWVVLSGCETGRSSAGFSLEGLGLAHAFLSNGAEMVLAAVRPVADSSAAELMRRFYIEWTADKPAAKALQAAQLGLRANDPDADWASFRILEP